MKNMKCRNNGITEIEVGYLSKPEGTVDMGTKWAIKRDNFSTQEVELNQIVKVFNPKYEQLIN